MEQMAHPGSWSDVVLRNLHWLAYFFVKWWKALFGGISSLWGAWKYRDRLRRSHNWPMVWGEVHTAEPLPDQPRTIEVTYNYAAAGSYYAGIHHRRFFWRKDAEAFAAQLRGQQVEVYYNPELPE
jgi:hypothetical protein